MLLENTNDCDIETENINQDLFNYPFQITYLEFQEYCIYYTVNEFIGFNRYNQGFVEVLRL